MNYKNIYNKLILNAKMQNRKKSKSYLGLFEIHHINPKFNGGTNEKDNIVLLTCKEHFIAHKLLHRIFNNHASSAAIWRMIHSQHKLISSSKEYQFYRTQFANAHSKYLTGKPRKLHTEETKKLLSEKAIERFKDKINHPMFSRTFSDESKLKISLSQKERLKDETKITRIKWTDEMKNKISESLKGRFCKELNPFFGKTHSDEFKTKIREGRIGGKWMNKELKSKFVFKDQIASHTSDGWQFGRI